MLGRKAAGGAYRTRGNPWGSELSTVLPCCPGTCKLRIRSGPTTPLLALRTLVRAAWTDQFHRGKRIALVNAEHRMKSFYHRIGFSYLEGCDFVHPGLGTQSCVLLMAADPGHRSYCQDIFAAVAEPYSQRALVDFCTGSLAVFADDSKTLSVSMAV